jgi:D-alanyl-D-alanine endopeptidase (penicillin-binding protein 7)
MVETAAAVPAKSSAHSKSTTVQKSSGKRSKATASATRKRKKRRAARKPPAGGVYARNAIVLDPATGQVLYEKNADRSAPIASLTKLMTAMVFLDQNPDLTRKVAVTNAEILGGGRTQLRNQEKATLGDLLHMSLMNSDNVATRVLSRESGLEHGEFIARMNRKSAQLGLENTRFTEVTGLSEHNVSTAADVARLLQAASKEPLIREITTTHTYEFNGSVRQRGRPHFIVNTNRLLKSRYEVKGGKTGFISEAGYCLATWVESRGRDMIAVVLGAPTNATRFADVVRLVQKTEALSASAH